MLFNLPCVFKRTNRLIITCGFVFWQMRCKLAGLSSLLLCMSMGAVLINTSSSEVKSKNADGITSYILMFFVVSGAELTFLSYLKSGL